MMNVNLNIDGIPVFNKIRIGEYLEFTLDLILI